MATGGIIKTKSNAPLVKKGLQDLGKEIPKIGRQQIYQVMVRSKAKLRKPGLRPSYPIKWDSIKQKLKVIILLRYTLGIPYVRRGIFEAGWQIKSLKYGYELMNESQSAQYLVGDAEGKGQSRIHKDRYLVMRDVIDGEMDKLPTAVVAHIEFVAKEKGFDTGS